MDGGDLVTWQQALQFCEGLEFAGHADWRLPNVRELQSIVDYGRFDPSIDPVFGAESGWYWSSSTNVNNPDNAWNVNFNDGNVNNNDDDKFPGCLLALQVGTFWELYGRSALALARALKLQLLHGRRRALQPWIRVPLDRLALVLEGACKAAIRDIVLITEESGTAGWVLDRRAVAVGRSAESEATS